MNNKYVDCFFDKKKTVDFFKGENDYFFRDPGWGCHSYYPSMGIVFDKIKDNLLTYKVFIDSFDYFVSTLEMNEKDSQYLWQNIYAYYLCLEQDRNNKFYDIFSNENMSTCVAEYISSVINKFKSEFYLNKIKQKFPHAGIIQNNIVKKQE